MGIDIWSKDLHTLSSLLYIHLYTTAPDLAAANHLVFYLLTGQAICHCTWIHIYSHFELLLPYKMYGHVNICPLRFSLQLPFKVTPQNGCNWLISQMGFFHLFQQEPPLCSTMAIDRSWVKNTRVTAVSNRSFWITSAHILLVSSWFCLSLIPGVIFLSYDVLVLGSSEFMTWYIWQNPVSGGQFHMYSHLVPPGQVFHVHHGPVAHQVFKRLKILCYSWHILAQDIQ